MVARRPRRPKVASLRRRAAAACIDTVAVVPPVIGVVVAAVALRLRYLRGCERDVESPRPFVMSPRWQTVLWAVSFPAAVATRNWRGPGYRLLGLRRVDARTGGPLTVRNVILQQAFVTASNRASRRLGRPWNERSRRQYEELDAERERIEQAHSGDRDAQRRATEELVKQRGVNPAGACAPLLVVAAATRAPALWSPLNQTVAERLAGIVVVVEE